MLVVYSQSRSVEKHISTIVEGSVDYRSTLTPPMAIAGNVYLVHAASFPRILTPWLKSACKKGVVIGIAADNPAVKEMLLYTQIGVKAYFNSHMSSDNFEQMIRLLSSGQSWFPPPLVRQVYELAMTAISRTPDVDPLQSLTKRERQVAIAVSKGNSNRLIADDFDISERTVKAHLTNIFKKLQIKDRVALAIHLNKFASL